MIIYIFFILDQFDFPKSFADIGLNLKIIIFQICQNFKSISLDAIVYYNFLVITAIICKTYINEYL